MHLGDVPVNALHNNRCGPYLERQPGQLQVSVLGAQVKRESQICLLRHITEWHNRAAQTLHATRGKQEGDKHAE